MDGSFAAFVGISAVVIMTPGQDTALTIRNALLGGRPAGVATAVGVAVGQGAARQIEEQIRSLGENFIWIEAGNRNVSGVRTGSHGTQSLTLRDMYAIQQQIPLLAQLSPNVDLRVQVIVRDQNWATQVRGVTPAFVAVRGWRLARGCLRLLLRRLLCLLRRYDSR